MDDIEILERKVKKKVLDALIDVLEAKAITYELPAINADGQFYMKTTRMTYLGDIESLLDDIELRLSDNKGYSIPDV